MSTLQEGNTRYVKLWLLLLKGGTYVSKKHIIKILKKDKTTIDICLKTHRNLLKNAYKETQINNNLWKLLCPDSGPSKNINVWDISTLVYVLLNLFDKRLPRLEKRTLNELRAMRNVMAHTGIGSVAKDQFLEEWNRLAMILTKLSSGLTRNHRDYVIQLIDDIGDIQDLDKAKDELKPFGNLDDFVKDLLAQHRSCEQRFNELDRRVSDTECKLESQQQMCSELKCTVVKNQSDGQPDIKGDQPEIKKDQHETTEGYGQGRKRKQSRRHVKAKKQKQ